MIMEGCGYATEHMGNKSRFTGVLSVASGCYVVIVKLRCFDGPAFKVVFSNLDNYLLYTDFWDLARSITGRLTLV